jgi:hypothetical protein
MVGRYTPAGQQAIQALTDVVELVDVLEPHKLGLVFQVVRVDQGAHRCSPSLWASEIGPSPGWYLRELDRTLSFGEAILRVSRTRAKVRADTGITPSAPHHSGASDADHERRAMLEICGSVGKGCTFPMIT